MFLEQRVSISLRERFMFYLQQRGGHEKCAAWHFSQSKKNNQAQMWPQFGDSCCPNFRHLTLCFAILKFLRMASLNAICQLRRNLKYFQRAGSGVASRLSEPRGCLRTQGRLKGKFEHNFRYKLEGVFFFNWRPPKMSKCKSIIH